MHAVHSLYSKEIPAEIHNKTQQRDIKKRKTSMQQYLLPHDVYATAWYMHTSSLLDVNCSQASWWRGARSSSKSEAQWEKVPRGLLESLTAGVQHLRGEWKMRRGTEKAFQIEDEATYIWSSRQRDSKFTACALRSLLFPAVSRASSGSEFSLGEKGGRVVGQQVPLLPYVLH